MDTSKDWIDLGREVLLTEMEGLRAVHDALDEHFVQALALLCACEGRVVVTGIGKSGLVGRKIAATFSSTGTPAFFLHPVEGVHGDMGSLRGTDIVIAISNSGETVELNALLPSLKTQGLKIVALTGRMDSTLGRAATITLNTCVPREACPHGLAPTASTTAVLALGDALAVCLMRMKAFTEKDFLRFHPGGNLGQRLRLNVREVMRTDDLPCLAPEARQQEALDLLNAQRLGAVIVVDADRCVHGILTDGDIRRALCLGLFDSEASVASIMTAAPRCGHVNHSVAQLLDSMEQRRITVLPVVDDTNRLLGMVHMHDLLGQGSVSFS